MTIKPPAPVTREERTLRRIAASVVNIEELDIVLTGIDLDQRIVIKDKLKPMLSFDPFDYGVKELEEKAL